MSNPERWKQRFQNLQSAYKVFQRRILEFKQFRDLEVYQMALVQGFEVVQELAWKTMKDFLENEGYTDAKNSKQTIRIAFQDGLLSNPDVWMTSIEIRNLTSHLYDPELLNKSIEFISRDFSPALDELVQLLENKP